LKPYINIFIGIDLWVATFANHVDVTMCIQVEECPTIKRLLINTTKKHNFLECQLNRSVHIDPKVCPF
jgi:hypothetical protein